MKAFIYEKNKIEENKLLLAFKFNLVMALDQTDRKYKFIANCQKDIIVNHNSYIIENETFIFENDLLIVIEDTDRNIIL